jgi:hypothetical protein
MSEQAGKPTTPELALEMCIFFLLSSDYLSLKLLVYSCAALFWPGRRQVAIDDPRGVARHGKAIKARDGLSR